MPPSQDILVYHMDLIGTIQSGEQEYTGLYP